ncbi:hypothetical protein Abr02nite_11160 [Paractinoplanes brasiliensis]|nr:hypothetical protein Abr02nite_11160 [Actinoplanes brasiliensis]
MGLYDSASPNVTGSSQPLPEAPTRAASDAAGCTTEGAAEGPADEAAEDAGGVPGAVQTDSLLSQAVRASTAAPRPARAKSLTGSRV